MVEELKKLVKDLESAKEFKSFKKDNPKSYLASCVVTVKGKTSNEGQINYYLPEKDKMTTFVMKKPLQVINEQEIFQKEKKEVKELEFKDIKINMKKALELLESFRKKKYQAEFPGETIVVLQVLEEGPVWNLTMLTATLKVLNVKMSAVDGEVLSDQIESFLQHRAG
jgi:hypothetical protein